MADIDTRLIADLELRTTNLERGWQRANRISSAGAKKMEKDGKDAAARLDKVFAGVGGGLKTAFSALGGAAGIGGFGLAGLFAGAKTAAADLANIAAEAQRAGVGVEALQELGYAAKQSSVEFDALIDGLKEMSLRADEFIVTGAGGGAEAFQRLGYGADELKAKLAQPDKLFGEIIDKLGRLDKASQIRIADELFGGTGGEQFVRLLSQGNGYIARMRQEARDTGNVIDKELIQRAIEIDREFNKLATTVGTNLKSALVSVVALLRDFTDMLRSTENQSAGTLQRRIDILNDAIAAMQRSPWKFNFLGGEQGLQQRIAERDQLQAQLDSKPRTTLTVTKPTGGMGDTSNVGKAQQLANAYKQIEQAAQARIAALNVETTATGMAQRAAEAYRFEQEALAEAQRAGITLTDAQRTAIGALASKYADASVAAQTAAESMERAAAAKQEFTSMGVEAVKGFVSDLRAGVSTTNALANGINRLADRLIDLAIDNLVGTLFKNLAGAIGGPALASLFGGFRAEGGDVRRGKAYVVGERGPEIFAPGSSGRIIPNHALKAPAAPRIGGAGPQNITVSPTINVSVEGGSRGPQADAEFAQRIGKEIEGSMRGVVVSELAKQMRAGGMLNRWGS